MDSIPRAAVTPLIQSAIAGDRDRVPGTLVLLGATVMNSAERAGLTAALRNPEPAPPSRSALDLAEAIDALLAPREALPDGLVLSPEEALTVLEAAITGAFWAGQRPSVLERVIDRLEPHLDLGARVRLIRSIRSGLAQADAADEPAEDWQRILCLFGRPATKPAMPARTEGLNRVLGARR